jgi:hypothetical protein
VLTPTLEYRIFGVGRDNWSRSGYLYPIARVCTLGAAPTGYLEPLNIGQDPYFHFSMEALEEVPDDYFDGFVGGMLQFECSTWPKSFAKEQWDPPFLKREHLES